MLTLDKYYIPERIEQVDPDFLSYEEEMIDQNDNELILRLLYNSNHNSIKLSNPHNSILLFICGLTDEFDFDKARADTIDGSPPDIDIDFDALEREKAIDWVINHWGRDNVSNIITHGTFKPKSLARAFYRVTESSAKDLSDILKNIPAPKFGKEATLAEIVTTYPDLKKEDRFNQFYSAAEKLENMISNFGIHAAGIVISDFPIHDTVPVWKNSKAERITQYNKDEVENLGLIKFDFLGIDTLSIIKEAVALIKQTKDLEIDIFSIEDGDSKTYTLMHQGLLTGVFQMETSGKAKELIYKIKPISILEVSDISALNRPGPATAGMDKQYIENKANGYKPDDMPDVVANLLKDTYWTLVYQEQVMNLCSELAGFTLKEADDIRRAMGKKKKEVLDSYKDQFVSGCVDNSGLTEDYSENLWEELVGFADYCFNKAHSCSYSVITYISAYLKAHYPTEFFCALMTIRSQSLQPKTWAQKAPEYIQEGKVLDVHVYPPSVNSSDLEFTISDNEIYFGLNAIRDVGKTAARSIVKCRGKTPYKDIYDFIFRVNGKKVTIKTFISLIKAGAFDKMGYNRSQLLEHSQNLFDYVRDIEDYNERIIAIKERDEHNARMTIIIEERDNLRKQIKTFKKEYKKQPTLALEVSIENIEKQIELIQGTKPRRLPKLKLKNEPVKPELSRGTIVELNLTQVMEQAHYIGCYIGTHPAKMINNGCESIGSLYTGQRTKVCGVVNTIKKIKTKRGQAMAFMELDDSTGIAEIVVFPKTWSYMKDMDLTEGSLIWLNCKVEQEEPVKLIAESISIYKDIDDII
jgi:DNA polymerase-3 subunit alpha